MDETSVFTLTHYAFWSQFGKQIVVLDLASGDFLLLNHTAAALWRGLCEGQTPAMCAVQLATSFGMKEGQIEDDISSFLETMQARNLLARSGAFLMTQRRRQQDRSLLLSRMLPSFRVGELLEAWILIRLVDRCLKQGRQSFFSLICHIAQIPAQAVMLSDDTQLGRLFTRVKQVAILQPYRTACLHVYVTLWWMLRRRGKAVDLVIGCYTHPFSAHVWLECQQAIIHWQAGMGQYAELSHVKALSVIFHSSSAQGERT